jgi:hypothetical protein
MVRELVKGCTAKGDEVSEKESARAEFLKEANCCARLAESQVVLSQEGRVMYLFMPAEE